MKTIFKNICLLLIVIALVAAWACKKSATKTTTCKLTKVQTGTDTALISYDSEGRVATYGSLMSGRYSFTYSGLTAGSAAEFADTTHHSTDVISLDGSGRLVFMSRTNHMIGNIFNYTYSVQYNADGYAVWCEQSSRIVGTSDVTYYKDSLLYADGNLTDKYTYVKYNSGAYTPWQHIKVEYGSELNKVGGFAFYGEEPPLAVNMNYYPFLHLLGKTSKNLPAITRVYDNNEDLYMQLAFNFLLNENGYPTEENMIRSVSHVGAINRKFEYSCE